MSLLISCDNVEKRIGNRELFEGLSFRVHERERIGLIGPNGAGKSTLLKILAGIVHAEGGDITLRKNLRLVYLPQVEAFNPAHTILEAALDAMKDDVGDDHQKEAGAMIMLGRLGFEDVNVKVGGLSGGWQKRLSIARQIARAPDVLLLDEPTNHLDVEGIEWLEVFLKTAPFAYIMISHDRRLLDGATNRIIELNPMFDGGNLSYDCAYNEFMQRRAIFLESERTRLESLANKNRREQEWVKAGVKARGTKQRSRLNAAEELMQTVQTLKRQTAEPKKVLLEFEATERKTKRLIVMHGVSKSYGDRCIINKLDLTLMPGKRIGLLGNNGTGKSTLMKLIAGDEKPDVGGVTVANGCRIVYFKQDRQFLDEKQSLREALSVSGSDIISYQGESIHINAWASRLKFRSDQMDTPVGSLSGGERARVIMGRLMQQDADVLLLDEPTNDLDIGSIEVLEESLKTFPGALVLVTHDREMLDRVCNQLLALDGKGSVVAYASFGQWKDAQKPATTESKQTAKVEQTAEQSRKPTKLSYKEQREWDSMEDSIMQAEQTLETLQNNPVDASNAQVFTAYCQQLSEAQLAVDSLYARWAELEARVKGTA